MEYRIPSSKLWSHNIWSLVGTNHSQSVPFYEVTEIDSNLRRFIYRFNFRSQSKENRVMGRLHGPYPCMIRIWIVTTFNTGPDYQWCLIVSEQMKMIWKESKIGNEWTIGKARAFLWRSIQNVQYTGKDTVAMLGDNLPHTQFQGYLIPRKLGRPCIVN